MGTFGITQSGFVMPLLTDIQTDINNTLKSKFGANINLGPQAFFGQISGVFSEREELIWQAMQDVYNSENPDQAFGASLDNIGSLRGIPRLGASMSTIQNVRLFGTAGTPIPAGTTQFSVQGSPTSLFSLNSAVTLAAGQSCIQTLTFSGIPASGAFELVLGGSVSVPINWNDSALTIQGKVQALQFASGCTVTGTPVSGPVTITFNGAGTGGFMVQPQFTVINDSLQTSLSAPVTVTPLITQAGIDQANVSVTATADGPTLANAGTLTVIATPITGLSAVLNTQDALLGRNVELDNPYRARMAIELQIAGAGTVEAIRSKLLQVAGVTAVIVFENTSLVTDLNGLPPKSFEAIVQGGTDADIGNTIWATKPAGIQTFGSSSFVITDSQGMNHTMFFSRPTQLLIYIIANITVDLTFPVGGDETVKDALVNYGNSLGIGTEVIVSPKLISSLANIQGIQDVVLLIGTSPGPTMSNNIIVAANQIAVFDTSRVSVVHV